MEIDGARAMAVPGIAIYADTDAIAFHDRFGAGQPILPGNGNSVEPNFDRRVTRGLLRGAVEAESPGALEFEAKPCADSVANRRYRDRTRAPPIIRSPVDPPSGDRTSVESVNGWHAWGGLD